MWTVSITRQVGLIITRTLSLLWPLASQLRQSSNYDQVDHRSILLILLLDKIFTFPLPQRRKVSFSFIVKSPRPAQLISKSALSLSSSRPVVCGYIFPFFLLRLGEKKSKEKKNKRRQTWCEGEKESIRYQKCPVQLVIIIIIISK